MEELTGRRLSRLGELVEVARSLVKRYVKLVVVSGGKGEVLVVGDGKVLILAPPSVKSLNPVGAGDALVAGFAVGLLRGTGLEEMASLGVAAGTASVEKGREEALLLGRIEKLANKVRYKDISPE
jgi:fructose-1-phosphate kinase PfkB-like protein